MFSISIRLWLAVKDRPSLLITLVRGADTLGDFSVHFCGKNNLGLSPITLDTILLIDVAVYVQSNDWQEDIWHLLQKWSRFFQILDNTPKRNHALLCKLVSNIHFLRLSGELPNLCLHANERAVSNFLGTFTQVFSNGSLLSIQHFWHFFSGMLYKTNHPLSVKNPKLNEVKVWWFRFFCRKNVDRDSFREDTLCGKSTLVVPSQQGCLALQAANKRNERRYDWIYELTLTNVSYSLQDSKTRLLWTLVWKKQKWHNSCQLCTMGTRAWNMKWLPSIWYSYCTPCTGQLKRLTYALGDQQTDILEEKNAWHTMEHYHRGLNCW